MFKIEKPETAILAKQAFITRQQPLLDEVCKKYGRNPLTSCIKVFYGNPLQKGQDIKTALWGDNPSKYDVRKNTTVFAGTQVQNILWKYYLSPRVYAIFEAEYGSNRVICQLTDFVQGETPEDMTGIYRMWDAIENIGKQYGFTAKSHKMSINDVVGGKCVDLQLWAFDNTPYLETVKRLYCEKGKYGKVYYQDEERIGLHGAPRKSNDRIKYMQLDKIDFKDKVVWDIGCAGGFFLRYAIDRGAKRVIGFDMKEPLEAAFHVDNYLGYFNNDYVEADLKRGIPSNIMKPDIAFFLSVNLHIGIPKWLFEANTIIFEDNSYDGRSKEVLGEPWISRYKDIKFVGRGLDHGSKSCYILKKII